MAKLIKSSIAPLLSLTILMLGSGFFGTFVVVRMKLEGHPSNVIGLLTSAYFLGLVIGSIRAHKLIERIGHIRAFSFLAALTATIILIQGIFFDPWIWAVIRLITGFCLAGLFITIESWLLAKSSNDTKGKMLSFYMISYYGALALGQFLLNFIDPTLLSSFFLAVILISISIFPVCLTRTTAPLMPEPSFLKVFQLLKIAPLGIIGATLSGATLGALFGLLPVFVQEIGLSIKLVAQTMGITLLGGLLLQWPIGHLSDYVDRRRVLLVVSSLTTILSIAIAIFASINIVTFLILVFLFGGVSFTIYPLSISHSCDLVESKDIIATTGRLTLVYGSGAIVGPIIASYTMELIGPYGFFYYCFAINLILSLYVLRRILKVPPVSEKEKVSYLNFPRTTPLVSEFNPKNKESEK